MMNKRNVSRKLAMIAATAGLGVLLQGNCNIGLQALAVGLQAAAGTLTQLQPEDNGISFNDWLASELSN